MKLESHLPRGTGPLHLAPVLDVVMLLLIFFLIGSSFVLQSGVAVDVPVGDSVLQPDPEAYIVTLSPPSVEGSRITFNGRPVSLEGLKQELELGRESRKRQVIVLGDRNAKIGELIPIFLVAESFGYKVAIATRSSDSEL